MSKKIIILNLLFYLREALEMILSSDNPDSEDLANQK